MPNLGPTSPQTPQPQTLDRDSPGGQSQQHSGGHGQSPGIPPRGISYPPVSPKSSLRRQKVLQASQSNASASNQTPPLLKSRPVTSDGITIPVITGVPSNIDDEMEDSQNLEEKSIEDQGGTSQVGTSSR